MAQREQLVEPFNVDLGLNYEQRAINVAFVEPNSKKPFHVFLTKLFEDEFKAGGDTFSIASPRGKFPQGANMGVSVIDDGLEGERHPWELHGKHQKPRDGKKSVYLFTTPTLPTNIDMKDDSLSLWMRGLMTRNACHNGVVIEGEASATDLQPGARAVVSTMEGDTQVIVYDGDKKTFFHNIAQRLRLQAGAHMVTKKEGLKVQTPTFRQWYELPEVQEIAYASRLLAKRGLLWDLDLREYAGRVQVEAILRTLRQAGLSEGNLSAVVPNFAGCEAVMAITETGIRKTRINPARGEVVAVPELTQNGARYLIMNGLPESHPLTFFRYPSRDALGAVAEGFLSAFRRGKLREYIKNMVKGESPIDHPSSVETFENGHAFRFTALREDGRVNSTIEYLQYLVHEYKNSKVIPVIPAGVQIEANADIHTHKTQKDEQIDASIKGVSLAQAQEDMQRLGFSHTPPCGSAEAAIFFLMQVDHLYELYGLPQDRNEIRLVHLPGHGLSALGYNGMRNLADRFANNIQFEPHVIRW